MSNALATAHASKPSALAVMASRFSVEPAKLLSTLKNTVFRGASDDEMLALVVVANEYGLNPLTKEIYAFPAKGGGIVPVVSVDGWNNLANSHPQMDGLEFEFEHDAAGKLVSCTCSIYRKDRSRPVRVTEYLAECRRNTDPWKMEHRMLRHKALIQCVRVAFGFSGVHDEEEAAAIIRDVTPPSAATSVLFQPPAPLPETKPSRRKAAPAPEPQPDGELIDVPAASLAEQINARCEADGVTWQEVAESLHANGLAAFLLDSPFDASEEVLRETLAMWTQVVAAVKAAREGGAA